MRNSCAKKERTLSDLTFEVTNMCNIVNHYGMAWDGLKLTMGHEKGSVWWDRSGIVCACNHKDCLPIQVSTGVMHDASLAI